MLTIPRPPQNDEELYWLIVALFGIHLPRVSVCPDHVSPFDAVAHAFFGKEPNFAVWYASRGSGKSLALAVLGLVKAFVYDVDVTILGGSMTQSLNVREHMRTLMASKNAPTYAVDKDQATLIQMETGRAIKPLPASQTTVRGPHPPLQLLDECLIGSTPINTPLGPRRIDSLSPGDTVWSWTDTGLVERTVLAARCTGVKQTLNLRLVDGRALTLTGNHPVLTDHGWVRADACQADTQVRTVQQVADRPWQADHADVSGLLESRTAPNQDQVHLQGLRWPVLRDWGQRAGTVPDVCSEGQGSQGHQMSGLRQADQAARREMSSLLAGALVQSGHDTADGTGSGYRAQDQGQDQQARNPDDGTAGSGSRAIPTLSSHREMDHRLRATRAPSSHRGARSILARPSDSHRAGRTQAGQADRTGLPGALRPDRANASLVAVAGVEAGPEVPVYNLTVAGEHNYLANGIVVHNCDEMEKEIYDASMGQAMEQINTFGHLIEEYIVASSTWQNPEGTFTDVMEDARDKGMPIFSWCIAEGSLVLTARGEVPIEKVTTDDLVMTRSGWKPVQHVTNMGTKPTVAVELSNGRTLRGTADHLVASGRSGSDWVAMGDLIPGSLVVSPTSPTHPISSVRSDVDVAWVGHVVPSATSGSPFPMLPRSPDILRVGNQLQMAKVDTDSSQAGMVWLQAIRDWSDQVEPDSFTGVVGPSVRPLGDPIVASHGIGPVDVVVGVDEELGIVDCSTFHVVRSTPSTESAVYDIGVYDEHEFTVEGVIVHNCWRELLQPNGWMSTRFIENKRRVVSAQMWHTEYELNEPSAGSRAFDLDKVALYFEDYPDPIFQMHKGNGDHDVYIWEKYQKQGLYAVGADWAKEHDKTVIAVVRYDITPHRLVKLTRVNRRPWDAMISMFNSDTQEYQAVAEHDGTGLGNVVNDYVDYSDTTNKFVMIGRARTEMLLAYIADFEHGAYRLPVIPANLDFPGVTTNPLYRAHRAVTVADVYAPTKWNSHLPDDIAAMALAHRALSKLPAPPQQDGGIPKDETPREADKRFHVKPEGNQTMSSDGIVTVVDDRYGIDDASWLVMDTGSRDEWAANI